MEQTLTVVEPQEHWKNNERFTKNIGRGRPPGSPNRNTIMGRDFARDLLASEEYQESLKRRIVNGTLSPLIEILLYHYAYGKPKDTLEIQRGPVDLSHLSNDELASRAHTLAKLIVEREQQQSEHLTNERTIEAEALRVETVQTPNSDRR